MAMTPLPDQVRSRPRYRVMLASGIAIGACGLLLAACGSTAAPATGAPATGAPTTGAPTTGAPATSAPATGATGSSSAAQAAAVSLYVTFAASANAPAAHYTLHCEPASGTVPDPAAACTKLLTGSSLFAPRPARIVCPMIMVGAGRATVTGTYLGHQVHETIVDGGCDLSRWAKLKAVFT